MKLRITLEGRIYEVDVEVLDESPSGGGVPPLARPSEARVAAPAAAPGAPPPVVVGVRACTAPLPGTITQVLVKPGDAVEHNQTLIVVEAMKMESSIPSPVSGRVKAVCTRVGAAVKEGDVLVEFE
jgi:biotin carboxyl carrier protein